ncbi:MAG TPA: GH92 family glycosyl hydrolase [Mycobacteriales bacterium]|nr:GH92 family glycosyl hydrolase [Mycobacteriales bacterium]
MRLHVAVPMVVAVLAGVTPIELASHVSAPITGSSAKVGDRLTTGAELVRLANVFAGTDTKLADQHTGGSAGNMSPAATAPFGMLSWGPRTSPDSVAFGAGYTYSDSRIAGFDLDRFQGGGCAGFGDVPIMPTTTAVTSSPARVMSSALDPALTASFSHSNEAASPGRYAVTLDPGTDKAIGVDLGANTRAGVGRFTFPASAKTGTLVINAGGSQTTVTAAAVQVDPATRTVDVNVHGGRFCEQPVADTLHVVLRFDRSFGSFGVWQREGFREGGRHASSRGITGLGDVPGAGIPPLPDALSATAQAGAVVRFPVSHGRAVGVHVGMSYVSRSGARAALDREVARRSVSDVQRATAQRWARMMGRVSVAGGVLTDRRMLATTLYQSLLSPQVISDVDGRYPGFGDKINRSRHSVTYSQMSLWDEYRTHAQLLALVAPRQARDMARSLLADERIAGFLPRWPVVGGSPDVMVGDPAVPFLADLEAFGVNGFSRDAALAAAVHGAASNGVDDESPAMLAGVADPETLAGGYYVERPANPVYLALHYVPVELDASTNTTGGIEFLASPDLVWGSASTSLEYATADFATSRLADAVKKRSTAREFLVRAGWWHDNFDTADGYVEPRSATGLFLPIGRTGAAHGFVEGDGSQYTFMVPFDVAGLSAALGGSKALVARLNTLFTKLNAGPSSAFAFLGNEPQLDTPYEYLWAGRPDLTESVVHRALDQMYAPTPGGYPGNIDGGTMTSWWIWNAIGLYPAIPGDDVLTLGAPRFSRVEISLPRGRLLRIEAPGGSRATPYVDAASVDGRPLGKAWLRYSKVEHGATIRLRTSAQPSVWARSVSDAPPSYS